MQEHEHEHKYENENLHEIKKELLISGRSQGFLLDQEIRNAFPITLYRETEYEIFRLTCQHLGIEIRDV